MGSCRKYALSSELTGEPEQERIGWVEKLGEGQCEERQTSCRAWERTEDMETGTCTLDGTSNFSECVEK